MRHTPDFFVRRTDGTALVVDVRPAEWIEPQDGHPLYGSRRRRGGLASVVGEVFWLAAWGLLDVDLYLAVDRRPLDNQCAGVGLGHAPGAS